MQRRTIWDQSTSSGLTSVRGRKGAGELVAPLCASPAEGVRRTAISGASILRRDGLAGALSDRLLSLGQFASVPSPIPLQLNVPTHCMDGLYAGIVKLVPSPENALLSFPACQARAIWKNAAHIPCAACCRITPEPAFI